ncbi:hypothetical protein ACQ4PT_067855 [Festuca glaucescens]
MERRVVYNNCCKGEKVFVEPFKEPPEFLRELINFDGPPRSKGFIEKIRQYNCLFAFTSMGATVDRSENSGGGPNIFKISGSVCHRIGSLLPQPGNAPKFAELYMYHGGDEVDNRIQALRKDDKIEGTLDKAIVKGLEVMLDTHNSLVKKFRMAKQVLAENEFANVSIHIVAPGLTDGPQFNLPSMLDVIGKISHVSDVVPVQSLYQTEASNTRTIVLTNLLGAELRLVPWGDRAVEFDVDLVRAMGDKEPVIGIFVGTLTKNHRGVTGLSGSSACRYLGEQFTPLSAYVPTVSDALPARFYAEPVEMTMKELNDVDPFVDMEKRFICSVTVDFITADQRWWFASCKLCHKSAKHDGYQFHCTGEACGSVKADLAYCVSFFASDATGGAEFVMFDKVGVAAVGKHPMTLMHQRYPGHSTVDEIVAVARHDTSIPAEISQLVNQKYKLLVSISKKWKIGNNVNDPLAFQVCRIIETYKPELPPLSFAPGLVPTALSSSAGGSGTRIPPLGPVMSPGLHAPQATGSPHNQAFCGGYGSPVAQALVDDAAAAADGKEDNVVLSKGAAVGVKEDGVVLPKSKRGASANKPGGAIKKPKV